MKPAKSEHYVSTHRKLQCFQMRGNSDFWTCPTPNQTGMKNPWKPQAFTLKYIICPMCQKISIFYSPYCVIHHHVSVTEALGSELSSDYPSRILNDSYITLNLRNTLLTFKINSHFWRSAPSPSFFPPPRILRTWSDHQAQCLTGKRN